MLSPDAFVGLVDEVLKRPLNGEQRACVVAGTDSPLLIIAGPGTGKTTVMVLRALRHLLVDGMLPETIVVTTFTKKAAQEVRTRWLDWGLPLLEAALTHPDLQNAEEQAWLRRVDLNRCLTGTLDSICEDLLSEYRIAGTVPPVLIEGYPANQRLMREGLANSYRQDKDSLDGYLATYTFGGDAPRTQGDLVKVVRPIVDRFIHDRVDVGAYRASAPNTAAKEAIAASYDAYRAALAQTSQMDFALLEQAFLERMSNGEIDEAVLTWKAVLVDEYQDTNPLQESIYFEIVRRSAAALSVVGDDDQSLYRFRGATVELFTRFVARLRAAIGLQARTEYLFQNYRSTPEVITFFNNFVLEDPGFAPARIQPAKPAIAPVRKSEGLPVLGMFRQSADDLAIDLAGFLERVFRGGGADIAIPGAGNVKLGGAANGGDFGDAVMLSHSVNEFKGAWGQGAPEARLPFLLRQQLEARGVRVFNPRGQALSDQVPVQVLLGLVLECLDHSSPAAPDGVLTPGVMGLTNVARGRLLAWRTQAINFMASNPAPGGLTGFVNAWAARASQSAAAWPDDWPLLELVFKLITWLPAFQTDPEHQVWLEAVSRAAAQSRLFSPYGGSILNQAPHDVRSRESVIRDILRPIAEGLVEVDEDLVTDVPRGHMSIMTIHQSKGLEFPLVIVDVSSGYKRNHRMNAAFRFPDHPSSVTRLEDDLAPFTEVGRARTARGALDRSFDDLMRLYYVAYSRPQTALLLVGLDKTITTASTVRTLASGWRRDGTWSWHNAADGRTTLANCLPLVRV